jgi:hypothetical protein
MHPSAFKIGSQFPRAALSLRQCLNKFCFCEIARLIDDKSGKRQGLIELCAHRLVSFGLAAIPGRFHGEPDKLQNMRSILLGVLALDEGIVGANALRDRAGVDHLARCKKVLNFRSGKAIGGLAEGARDSPAIASN